MKKERRKIYFDVFKGRMLIMICLIKYTWLQQNLKFVLRQCYYLINQ